MLLLNPVARVHFLFRCGSHVKLVPLDVQAVVCLPTVVNTDRNTNLHLRHSAEILSQPVEARRKYYAWLRYCRLWLSGICFPVSRFQFTDESSVYWPIIGLGTRNCGVAKRCRDPAVQCEFFARVSRLKTFN